MGLFRVLNFGTDDVEALEVITRKYESWLRLFGVLRFTANNALSVAVGVSIYNMQIITANLLAISYLTIALFSSLFAGYLNLSYGRSTTALMTDFSKKTNSERDRQKIRLTIDLMKSNIRVAIISHIGGGLFGLATNIWAISTLYTDNGAGGITVFLSLTHIFFIVPGTLKALYFLLIRMPRRTDVKSQRLSHELRKAPTQ